MRKRDSNFYIQYCNYRRKYDILYKWMLCDIHGRSVVEVLQSQGIRRVAIYGAAELGVILYRKLQNSSIEVDCFVDKYSMATHYGVEDIEIIKPNALTKRPNIDLIIIAVTNAVNKIQEDLEMIGNQIPVMTLENLIMNM
ncbi:MAG: hypothetical protein NC242_03895 [Roseburia sp.]|nr:hypothetical protein [Roseburia sp.]MCM1429857.1 hypothetical protein [Muribaculaceae bacterium]